MNFEELQELGAKELARQEQVEHRLFCCTSTACLSAGAGTTHSALDEIVEGDGSNETVAEVVKTGCMGLCSRGPLVRVESKGKPHSFYQDVTPEVAEAIVSKHVPSSSNGTSAPDINLDEHVLPQDIPFFTLNGSRQ